VRGAAKVKGQKTKSFLRVLKYSNGGVLEVRDLPPAVSFFCLFVVLPQIDCFARMENCCKDG
jgi:hypothetical protein